MNETGPKSASQSEIEIGDPAVPTWARFEPPLMLQGGELGELVGQAFPGARATAVEFLDRGVVNSNYRVDLAGGGPADPAVVRLRLSRSDEGPRREGALGELLHERCPGLAPRLLATTRGESPEPHRRSLFTWIEGEALDEFVPRRGGAAPEAEPGRRCFGELAQALFGLHGIARAAFGRLDVAACPRGDERDAARDAARRADVRFRNPAHGLSPARVDTLRAGFARLIAPLAKGPGGGPCLVHGDLSPGNIIVRPDAETGAARLSGLIDWEMARAADPAYDFASLRLEWRGPLAAPARVVERDYLALVARAGAPDAAVEWERRVAVALVPRLLDARMVAERRRAAAALAALDEELDALLRTGPGIA